MATTFIGHFLGPGTHSSRPATTGLPEGTMYVCTTHAKIERVVSAAWADYATLGSGTANRVLATAGPGATPTVNTDSYDVVHLTALAAAVTSMTTNLTGTPVDGQTIRISFTDNGTARAITWGASFEASTVALPTTTVANARLDTGFFWNTETSKWRCVAVA